MNRTRSLFVRRKLTLESLEERWTPATGSTSLAWLAGLRAGLPTTTVTGTGTLDGTVSGSTTPVVTTPSTPSRYFNGTYLRAGSIGSSNGSTVTPSSPTTPTTTTPTTTTPVITRIYYFSTNYLRAGSVNSAQTRSAITTTGTASSSNLSGTVSTPTVSNVSLESASSMSVASKTTTTPTQAKTTVTTSASTSATTVPANVSGDLAALYINGVDATKIASPTLNIVGSNVGVSITGTANGDFNAMITSLRNLGMQIQSSDATYHTVRGMLPISQIPTAAAIPQVMSISALRKPTLR
ncbi:hypothetical protein [Paludisphaera rhizosphaerae]|uniref:hypothetical protein n=1 Tax=Paludisphaera rhizosphaerae TaxID=2711216 RepID=UPI0013ED5B0C|nr:hypothetical protein [Paludisphaera rhizosphaerae]